MQEDGTLACWLGNCGASDEGAGWPPAVWQASGWVTAGAADLHFGQTLH